MKTFWNAILQFCCALFFRNTCTHTGTHAHEHRHSQFQISPISFLGPTIHGGHCMSCRQVARLAQPKQTHACPRAMDMKGSDPSGHPRPPDEPQKQVMVPRVSNQSSFVSVKKLMDEMLVNRLFFSRIL